LHYWSKYSREHAGNIGKTVDKPRIMANIGEGIKYFILIFSARTD